MVGLLFSMYYDLFDNDTPTLRAHFVNNFAAFAVSMTLNLAYKSSEVVDFRINRKRVYDFLLDLDSNPGPILPCFRDIRAFVCRKPLFPYPSAFLAKISGYFTWSRSVMLGSAESEHPRLTNRELFLMISNLCDHDTSTSQTDGQTDRQTCRSNTALCVDRAVKIKGTGISVL